LLPFQTFDANSHHRWRYRFCRGEQTVKVGVQCRHDRLSLPRLLQEKLVARRGQSQVADVLRHNAQFGEMLHR
jgi:hypothetical protein